MVKVAIFVVLVVFAALFFAGPTAAYDDLDGNPIEAGVISAKETLEKLIDSFASGLSSFGFAAEQIQEIKGWLVNAIEAISAAILTILDIFLKPSLE